MSTGGPSKKQIEDQFRAHFMLSQYLNEMANQKEAMIRTVDLTFKYKYLYIPSAVSEDCTICKFINFNKTGKFIKAV